MYELVIKQTIKYGETIILHFNKGEEEEMSNIIWSCMHHSKSEIEFKVRELDEEDLLVGEDDD